MSEAFTRWDVTEHLRTREDARLYLEACAEEDPGDGSLIRAALNDIARAGNMSRLARDVGMSREGLYKALSEDGNPSFATVDADYAGVGDASSDYACSWVAEATPAAFVDPRPIRWRGARGVPADRLPKASVLRSLGLWWITPWGRGGPRGHRGRRGRGEVSMRRASRVPDRPGTISAKPAAHPIRLRPT